MVGFESEDDWVDYQLENDPRFLGRIEIAVGGQQEVDGRAVLVDGAVQVPPLATDLDVSLVDAQRAAVWLVDPIAAKGVSWRSLW